jgi:hypothetical protein
VMVEVMVVIVWILAIAECVERGFCGLFCVVRGLFCVVQLGVVDVVGVVGGDAFFGGELEVVTCCTTEAYDLLGLVES